MPYLNMTTANTQQTLKVGDMPKLNTNFEVTVPCSNNTLENSAPNWQPCNLKSKQESTWKLNIRAVNTLILINTQTEKEVHNEHQLIPTIPNKN